MRKSLTYSTLFAAALFAFSACDVEDEIDFPLPVPGKAPNAYLRAANCRRQPYSGICQKCSGCFLCLREAVTGFASYIKGQAPIGPSLLYRMCF